MPSLSVGSGSPRLRPVSAPVRTAGSGEAGAAAAHYRRFRETRFFGSLDGLRAISILGVIWFHAWFATPQYSWLARVPVLREGTFGVDIFFTISGFLITTLLLRERSRTGTLSLKDFYVRRALRILPLYYGVFLLYGCSYS